MKTSTKTLITIYAVIISLSLTAQRNHNGGNQSQQQSQPQQQNNSQSTQNNNQNDKHHGWSSNHHHPHHESGNWGGITVHLGGFPIMYGSNYGNNNGYSYYNNNDYYSIKKAARNSIRQSANIIGQALQFSDWNDTYSPWLAKAIRHQQYAKQLYSWGDYDGALNHAERAGFLAYNTLSYFNNPYGYNNNAYPDPYSDPNNPYYRQSNSNSTNQPNTTTNSDEDFGYRKGSTEKTTENNDSTKKESRSAEQKMDKTVLDASLPQSKLNDKELLKTNVKDLDVD